MPPGVRLYHTVTSLPGGDSILYGGRSSPLNPIRSLLKVTVELCDPPESVGSEDQGIVKLSIKEMACTGDTPKPRWRHSATMVSHSGERESVSRD